MSWIKLLVTFLLSLALSVDDLVVGVSYGLRHVLLRARPLAIMLFGSTVSMTLSMAIGKLLNANLSHTVSSWASALILVGLGLHVTWEAISVRESGIEHNTVARNPFQEAMRPWEAFTLGTALGVDDFAEALGLLLWPASPSFSWSSSSRWGNS